MVQYHKSITTKEKYMTIYKQTFTGKVKYCVINYIGNIMKNNSRYILSNYIQ